MIQTPVLSSFRKGLWKKATASMLLVVQEWLTESQICNEHWQTSKFQSWRLSGRAFGGFALLEWLTESHMQCAQKDWKTSAVLVSFRCRFVEKGNKTYVCGCALPEWLTPPPAILCLLSTFNLLKPVIIIGWHKTHGRMSNMEKNDTGGQKIQK